MTSFAQVCAELDRRRHVTLGFERIEALLTAMGNPERAVPGLVQVVGTNGKGTTALALAAALEEMGYPSGAYLSPHVLSYTERVVLHNVSIDHTEYLGETVEAIAEEKLASLKPGATLFLGTDEAQIIDLAHSACLRVGSRLVLPGEAGENASFSGLAPYEADDVHLGIAVAESMLQMSLPPEVGQKVARAVGEALPGRFEVCEVEGVPVVVDGGHNAAGLSAALAGMRAAYGDRPLAVVFGVLREKDAASMLAGLKGQANFILLTRPENDRAADPALLDHKEGTAL